MYSCWGSSIGNLRISARYRERPDSPLRIGRVAVRAIRAPSTWFRPPIAAGQAGTALLKPVALRCSALGIQRKRNIHQAGLALEVKPPSRSGVAAITCWHIETFLTTLRHSAAVNP